MSICTPARSTMAIPVCLDLLEVGDITPDTAVTVYLNDVTLNQPMVFQETSYNSGRVIIDLSTKELTDKHAYELWMTMPGEPIDNRIAFTIEGDTDPVEIAQVKFHEVTENGEPFPVPSIVLKAA